MTIKLVTEKSKTAFNKAATHPLQSWEWGEFRKKTGNELVRFDFGQKSSNPPSRLIIDIPENLLETTENTYPEGLDSINF